MKSTLGALLALAVGARADDNATCVPQYSPYPISCVDCSGPKTPVNVPFDDITKLWGVWHVIGSEYSCTDTSGTANVCTQLNFSPNDPSDITTDLAYLSHYNKDNQPYGKPTDAVGAFYPKGSDFSAEQAPYRLEIPAGSGIMSDFYFLATDGDSNGDGINTMVTFACPDTGTDSQMFILSRKPYLVAPTTFDTISALAAQSITNFDDHQFTLVKQMPGWCNYTF